MTKTEQRIREMHEELAHVAKEEQVGYIILATTPSGILHAEACTDNMKKEIIRSMLRTEKDIIMEIMTEFQALTGGNAKRVTENEPN